MVPKCAAPTSLICAVSLARRVASSRSSGIRLRAIWVKLRVHGLGDAPVLFMAIPSDPAAPIGAFDSGVGGLSVLRAIRARLPGEDFIYVADQAHVPYGPRGLADVRKLSEGIVRFLIAQNVKLIVIPCNTAFAAALRTLREQYPGFPFVGMEPAGKPPGE